MAELVDALVSGASVERRAGSSPVLGTNLNTKVILEIRPRSILFLGIKNNEGFVSLS